MNNSLKVDTFEALCIILIGVIGQNILIMPKFVIQSQGSSSIVNVIYITLIALILIVIFNSLYKNLHRNGFIRYIRILAWKKLKNHLRLCYDILLFVYSFFAFKEYI